MKTIYLVKDLAVRTGMSVYTIKYYLKLGLIKEIGRSPDTNFRYFSDRTIDRLSVIRQKRRENKKLCEIRKELKG